MKQGKATEAQTRVCPPWFPCSCTPVLAEAEGKEMADHILGSTLGCWPAYPSAKWCVRRLNHLPKKVWNPCFSSKQAGNCLLAYCENKPRNCAQCQKHWKMTLSVLIGAGPLIRWGTGTRQLSNYFNMHKKSGYAWSWLHDLSVELLFSPDFLLHLYCLFKMCLCLDWSFVIAALQASTSIALENITLKPAQLYKSRSRRQNTKHCWRLPGFPVKHRQSRSKICSNHHIPVTVPLLPHAMKVPFWLLLQLNNFSAHQMYSTTETHLPPLLHQNLFTSIVEHRIKLWSNLLPTGAGNGIARIRSCWAAQVL